MKLNSIKNTLGNKNTINTGFVRFLYTLKTAGYFSDEEYTLLVDILGRDKVKEYLYAQGILTSICEPLWFLNISISAGIGFQYAEYIGLFTYVILQIVRSFLFYGLLCYFTSQLTDKKELAMVSSVPILGSGYPIIKLSSNPDTLQFLQYLSIYRKYKKELGHIGLEKQNELLNLLQTDKHQKNIHKIDKIVRISRYLDATKKSLKSIFSSLK